jgi:hypothetical protein
MSSVFGKAKFGGNKRTWFKLKDGESVYRILPPMGDLQEDGRWSQFYRIHYGYKNSKGEMRTFQSPLVKNMKTKMTEVPDAALDRINQLTAKLEEAKKTKNEELVQQLLKLVGGQKSRYNLDSNHYLNVIDLQGNIGILKIRHKAKLALDAAIKRLRDAGVEPLDPETGRFFVFSRSGTARDTIYQVSVYKKKLHVDGVGDVEQDVVHTITEDIAKRCVVVNKDGSYTYKEAANLATLFKKPTAEEVQRIVVEGEKAIDEILDAKTASAAVTDYSDEDDSGSEEDETPVTTQSTKTKEAPVKAAVESGLAGGGTIDTTVSSSTVGKIAATIAAETTPATAPKTTAETVATLSDEEFLKNLGL